MEIDSNKNFSSKSNTDNNSEHPKVEGILDLSNPIKELYLIILKLGAASIEELANQTTLHDNNKDTIKIYLNILVKQGYLEKEKIENVVKYKAKDISRQSRTLPDEIWISLLKGNK